MLQARPVHSALVVTSLSVLVSNQTVSHWLLVALPHFLQSEIMIHSKHGGINTCCILTLQQITHRQTTCWMMSITGI